MRHRDDPAEPRDPESPPLGAGRSPHDAWHGMASGNLRLMVVCLGVLLGMTGCPDPVAPTTRDADGKVGDAGDDMAVTPDMGDPDRRDGGMRRDGGRPPPVDDGVADDTGLDEGVPFDDGVDATHVDASTRDASDDSAVGDAEPCSGQGPNRPGGDCQLVTGTCTADGKWECQGGALVCDATSPVMPEICNGVDDDCDGLIDAEDDDLPAGPICAAGCGPCRVEAEETCLDGRWQCPAQADERQSTPEVCDGIDNNCDCSTDADVAGNGIDDTPVCGEYMIDHCRLWLGWSRRQNAQLPGPDYEGAYHSWVRCPATYPVLDDDVRCNTSESREVFHLIPVDGNSRDAQGNLVEAGHTIANNDKLAWALECGYATRDAARARGQNLVTDPPQLEPLESWITDHCRVYLTHARGDDAPADALLPAGAGSPVWAPCDDEQARGIAGDRNSRCNSTTDFRFRPMQFPMAVSPRDALGVAFRCETDEASDAEQAKARSIETDVEVFLAWAPHETPGVMDRGRTWAGCGDRGAPPSDDALPLCVGSGGDGLFHGLRIGAGNEIGAFGFALKSRPRVTPQP